MTLGLVGKKIGMSREFMDSGTSVPVTVVKVEKGRVIDIYNKEKNGYTAIKLGFMIFKDVKFIDVRSQTIGKGFAGPMKRWNFSGLRASHGVSVSHRSHGSTGQRQDPGKVFKNKKMAGHMGSKFRTLMNLEVVKSDLENNLLYIKGSIPGSKNSTIYLRKSIKNVNRKTILEREKVVQQVQQTSKKTQSSASASKEKQENPKKEVKKN